MLRKPSNPDIYRLATGRVVDTPVANFAYWSPQHSRTLSGVAGESKTNSAASLGPIPLSNRAAVIASRTAKNGQVPHAIDASPTPLELKTFPSRSLRTPWTSVTFISCGTSCSAGIRYVATPSVCKVPGAIHALLKHAQVQ